MLIWIYFSTVSSKRIRKKSFICQFLYKFGFVPLFEGSSKQQLYLQFSSNLNLGSLLYQASLKLRYVTFILSPSDFLKTLTCVLAVGCFPAVLKAQPASQRDAAPHWPLQIRIAVFDIILHDVKA